MSLGGNTLPVETSTQQLVYGPDGKVYGSPAQARAAGVNNPTYQPPAPSGGMRDLPPDFIPLPGPVVSPMPNPPSGGKGGADPYSQIMGQMGYGSDPYSQIMSQMPVRQNPYAYSPGDAIGGYDPALYNNAFMGSNSRLNLSGLIGGGGGGGGGDGAGAGTGNAMAKGGYVHGGLMFGPNPPGPDDGAVNLDIGEYVIKKSSVNKYGRGLLDMINEGKVPAKKMKSLLG